MKKLITLIIFFIPFICHSQQANKLLQVQSKPYLLTAPKGNILSVDTTDFKIWAYSLDSLKMSIWNMLWVMDSIRNLGDSRYAQLLGAYSNPAFVNSLSAGKVFGLSTVATSGSYNDLTALPNLSLKYDASNPSGYINGITSGMVTAALSFTPYNSSNPSGYITSSALSPYQLLLNGTGFVKSTSGVISYDNSTYLPTRYIPVNIDSSNTNEIELASQTGNSGKVLSTNGSTTSWTTPNAGTATSVGLSSTDFSVSGSPVTTSGNITANLNTSGVSSGSYNGSYTVNTKGIVTAANSKTQSIVARTLGTSFQVSTTKGSDVNYSVLITLASALAGNASGTVQLQISSDNVTFNTASTSGYSIAGLVSSASNTQTLSAYVPVAYWVKIVYTSSVSGIGSTSVGTYQTGQEVVY